MKSVDGVFARKIAERFSFELSLKSERTQAINGKNGASPSSTRPGVSWRRSKSARTLYQLGCFTEGPEFGRVQRIPPRAPWSGPASRR